MICRGLVSTSATRVIMLWVEIVADGKSQTEIDFVADLVHVWRIRVRLSNADIKYYFRNNSYDAYCSSWCEMYTIKQELICTVIGQLLSLAQYSLTVHFCGLRHHSFILVKICVEPYFSDDFFLCISFDLWFIYVICCCLSVSLDMLMYLLQLYVQYGALMNCQTAFDGFFGPTQGSISRKLLGNEEAPILVAVALKLLSCIKNGTVFYQKRLKFYVCL